MGTKPLKVLYIHHSGVFGGASRSLLEMISSFPSGSVNPVVLLPKGSSSMAFERQGIDTILTSGLSQFDNTSYGHYRGFRWLIILREIFLLPATYLSIKKAKTRLQNEVDLIHVNEITNLPSVVLASRIFKKPIVLHVRSLQRSPNGLRNRLIYKVIKKFVTSIITIDKTVARSLPTTLNKHVIHNGFDPYSKINEDNDAVDKQLKSLKGKLKVVTVGNILFMKGIEEFVQAAKLAKSEGMQVDFIIVGDKPKSKNGIFEYLLKQLGLLHEAKQFVLDFIEENQLESIVHLIKFTPNITSVYKNIDVLCFPSHLNAVGRPVFEAAFLKKPSIVAIKDPLDDTIIHQQTGLCIEEKKPQNLYNAIKYYYENDAEILRMGNNAHELAKTNFDIKNNAAKVLNLYRNTLSTF